MKRPLIFAAASLLVCFAVAAVAYKMGQRQALTLQAGTFVVSLGALEKIRAGDIAEGTRKIESICFSSAAMCFEDTQFRQRVTMFVPSLTSYRHSFRTNQGDWTPTEKELERYLVRSP